MVQVCPRLKMTACWANDALAPAMSCMAAHAINDTITMNGTQMNAAFCTQISMAGPPVPDNATVRGEPPRGPNMPMVITRGVRHWTEVTHRLPSPNLRTKADPFRSLENKKLSLSKDDKKVHPTLPHKRASTTTQSQTPEKQDLRES